MMRDANGRAQVATPLAAGDIATKGYVDSAVSGNVPQAFVTLSDGATVTWDSEGLAAVNAIVTLAGNRALVIDNALSGTSGLLIVKQDNVGNRTLALPANSIIVDGGNGSIALSTVANAIDVLSFVYDGTTYLWSYGKNLYLIQRYFKAVSQIRSVNQEKKWHQKS